jgi:hypothetical protein
MRRRKAVNPQHAEAAACKLIKGGAASRAEAQHDDIETAVIGLVH